MSFNESNAVQCMIMWCQVRRTAPDKERRTFRRTDLFYQVIVVIVLSLFWKKKNNVQLFKVFVYLHLV